MKGLDLSKFKKTAQDKTSAKLMHPDGHLITIAIAGLTPEMRKKLSDLPLHQAEPEGEVESPEPQMPQQATAPTQVPDPEQVAPPVQQSENAQQEVPQPQQAAAPAPFRSDLARTPQTPLLPNETPEQHYANEVAFQQDLANRHIEPKTYSDLFAKKDTLGKIGTIFGLMLSGAGAGLTGGPNILMDMMNKEIDRDLEAQKSSKANANTFLKTQQDHDLQQAQMLHYSNQNALTQQQIKASQAEHAGQGQANAAVNKAKVEAAGGKWDNSIEKENAQVGNDLSAKNKMLSTVAQHLDDVTPNNPQAKQMLQSTIKPAIDQEIKQNVVKRNALQNTNTVKKAEQQTADQAANAGASGEVGNVIDMDKYHKMRDAGAFNEKNGIPLNSKKHISEADDKDIQAGITKRTVNEENYSDVMNTVKKLMALPNAGESMVGKVTHSLEGVPFVGKSLAGAADMMTGTIERERRQEIDNLKTRLVARGASKDTMDEVVNSLTPSMFDNPKTSGKIPDMVYNHFNHLEDSHPGVFQKYGLDKPIKKISMDVGSALKEAKSSGDPKNQNTTLDKLLHAVGGHRN